MRARSSKLVGVAAAAIALATVPVTAHAADAYWNQLCTNGGWTFNTCASAWVSTSGNTITLRIWNLAGLPGSGTSSSGGFTAVGLSNIGSGLVFQNLVAKRVSATNYAGWSFSTGGGGIPGPSQSNGVLITGIGDAIFSQYFPGPIPGSGSPEVTSWGGSGQFSSGYVSFSFDAYTEVCTGQGRNKVCVLTPTSVDLTNAVLGLHIQSGPGGQSSGYECAADNTAGGGLANPCTTITTQTIPEPITSTLMVTGLVGIGLAGVLKRRKNRTE